MEENRENEDDQIMAVAMSALLGAGHAAAADFGLSFEWGNLKKCNTGYPNSVPNPKFALKGVPAGTATIQFHMVDLNNRGYNHGGGTAKYAGGSTIAPGAFKYMSPCPPRGANTYEWTATAKDASGKKLGEAKARKKYP